MTNSQNTITQEYLHYLFEYKDGNLIWKNKSNSLSRIKIGEIAGCIDTYGYRIIRLFKKGYKAHRLIWIYHYGSIDSNLEIDHINEIKDDNRLINLRLVSRQENEFNKSSLKGYCWCTNEKKYKATIRINRKQIHLGYFKEEKDARNAYLVAKEKYHIIQNR